MTDHTSISTDSEYTVWETKSASREIRLLAISVMFSALAVASSSVLVFIPNLETLTLIFFLVGYRYGMRAGSGVAIISTILYEFVASAVWGPSGLIFFFKFPPYLFVACLGGLLGQKRRIIEKNEAIDENQEGFADEGEPWSLLFGIIGIFASLVYDLSTTVGFLVWTSELSLGSIIFYMMTGLLFTVMHSATNFVMFLTIPQINRSLDRVDPLLNN
ncbi:MAG: hypothetical protein ACFFBD_19465 [Candidatus Hodarchaeota archaeon]